MILEADKYSESGWRWKLTNDAGAFIADHTVNLSPTDALTRVIDDLYGYVKHMPDAEKAVERAGKWLGRVVLGSLAEKIGAAAKPLTVRVRLPLEAEKLLHCPLELAHANGQPLALKQVSFVYEISDSITPRDHTEVGTELRVLALFSTPLNETVLALRRERYGLKRLFERIAQEKKKAISFTWLQYGVTRDILRERLLDEPGWDILHISGHGQPGGLLLETESGQSDPVSSDELVDILREAPTRLKLVTLSACWSAARALNEMFRDLDISATAPQVEEEAAKTTALARALARELDVAVVAMRYPVEDTFAITLGHSLYTRMVGNGHSLTSALQVGLPDTLKGKGHGPLSVATPGLFGSQAANLVLLAPTGKTGDKDRAMDRFPKESEHFAGRVGHMAVAGAAFGANSGKTAVMFYGMAGAGKTNCAVELAHAFRTNRFTVFVWWKGPEVGSDIAGSLANLAKQIESQWPDFHMSHVVDSPSKLTNWLPELTARLEQESVLLVLDNLENLLDSDGDWRDERWGPLIAAMIDHTHSSRLVMTSRLLPQALGNKVQPIPVHALPRDEALLLARELPHLGRLLRKNPLLARRTLNVVQGHPKLIEFAESVAADPAALAQQVDRAKAALIQGGAAIDAFFQGGESSLDGSAFLSALSGWTESLANALPVASRTLFFLLCALEDGDRTGQVMLNVWPDLWRKLGQPGEAPALPPTLAPATAAGLLAEEGTEFEKRTFRLHPAVAEAGRALAANQAVVDATMVAFWLAVFKHGQDTEMQGGTLRVIHAGLAAAPYLVRMGQWDMLGRVLENVLFRDKTPQTLAAILPRLRQVAETTGAVQHLGILGNALLNSGQLTEATETLKTALKRALAEDDFQSASITALPLVYLHLNRCDPDAALALAAERINFSQRAGLGPWTQLADEALRLQILNTLGRSREVLDTLNGLRTRMAEAATGETGREAARPWNVQETILATAHKAAQNLKEWEQALTLSPEILASMKEHGATALEQSRTRFNDYGPLLNLGRIDEARTLLTDCRRVFEKAEDWPALGACLTALGQLENQLGHGAEAVAFERSALSDQYSSGTPDNCANSHFNLSSYLMPDEPRPALTHRLAACLIRLQISSGDLNSSLLALARDIVRHLPEPPVPQSFDALCATVEEVPGVRFRELMDRLPHKHAPDGETALGIVMKMAQEAWQQMTTPP